MRLKKQKSIFTGLRITFDDFSKPVGKNRYRKYLQGFFKNHNFLGPVVGRRISA